MPAVHGSRRVRVSRKPPPRVRKINKTRGPLDRFVELAQEYGAALAADRFYEEYDAWPHQLLDPSDICIVVAMTTEDDLEAGIVLEDLAHREANHIDA